MAGLVGIRAEGAVSPRKSKDPAAVDFQVAKGQEELDSIAAEVTEARRSMGPTLNDDHLEVKLQRLADVRLRAIDERYQLGEFLGQGRFSQVLSARRVDGERIMVQRVDLAAKEVTQRSFDETPDETMVRRTRAPCGDARA
eukprot:1341890-Prymnesium_polylepis.2